MARKKTRGKGVLGDVWNGIKSLFKSGNVGKYAKQAANIGSHVGNLLGSNKLSNFAKTVGDVGSRVQDYGRKGTDLAESYGFGKKRGTRVRGGMVNAATSFLTPSMGYGSGMRTKRKKQGGGALYMLPTTTPIPTSVYGNVGIPASNTDRINRAYNGGSDMGMSTGYGKRSTHNHKGGLSSKLVVL